MDDKEIYYIKFFKSDLISSLSYKSLPVYNKGIFNILFTLCRDGEYAGELCRENGKPMTIDEIIPNMDLQKGDRADRIKGAIQHMIDVGMIFWNRRRCLEIRKYAKKTGQLYSKGQNVDNLELFPKSAKGDFQVDQESAEGGPKVGQGFSAGRQEVVKPGGDIKGLTSEPETTEQKQTTDLIDKYITDNSVELKDEINYFPSLELLSFVDVQAPHRDRLAKEFTISRIVKVIKWAIKKADTNLPGLICRALNGNWKVV